MTKKAVSVVVGIFIAAVGVLLGGQALGFWPDYKFSMAGWWTVFLILPGILSIFGSGPHMFSSLITGLGILFLLDEQNVLQNDLGYKLAIPYALVVVGLSIVFKKREPREFREANSGVYAGTRDENYYAIFGTNTPQLNNADFRGANAYAIFGSIGLKLQNAPISHDCVINTYSIFGSVDITLPKDVRLLVRSVPIFGGVENRFVSQADKSAPAVLVRSVSVFGGVNII